MSDFHVDPPRRRIRVGDAFYALFCILGGLWLVTYGQQEWKNESLYRVQTRLSGPEGMLLSDEVKTGREMNRNRMILGVVAFACSGYFAWRATKQNQSSQPTPGR
jgi:hypothetical protein